MTFTPYTHHGIGTPDYMCPYCVTPWKCNGPHIYEDDLPQYNADMRVAYEQGLEDARDAVAALYDRHDASCDDPRCEGPDREFALAAIDALTDGGCRTPDDPCADPDACDSLTCARERLHLTLRDEADALASIDALRGE